jgi:hypothetical protein
MHSAEQCAGRQCGIVQPDLAEFAGLVDRRQYGDGEPRGILEHQKQADAVLHRAAVARVGCDDQDVSQMRIADKELGAGEGETAARLARRQCHAGGVPSQVGLGPGEGRLRCARCNLRQPLPALHR